MTPSTCYYDGACPVCRASIRAVKAIDWLERIRAADLTALPDEALPVTRQQAMESVTFITARGRVLRGIQAVRAMLVQTPLGLIPGALLYLPGLSHAGDALYKWISASRVRDEPPRRASQPGE